MRWHAPPETGAAMTNPEILGALTNPYEILLDLVSSVPESTVERTLVRRLR